jgi:nicotinamide-nucleotide amidase
MTEAAALLRVRLVAVGDELLAGDQVNSNGAVLGRELSAIGAKVVGHQVVGDDVDTICAAMLDAAAAAEIVVVCGGLGPTQDDVTREALTLATGGELFRDPELERGLREQFAALGVGYEVPEMNWRQADVPSGAIVLPNRTGSAPGLLLLVSGAFVYALPGVPREFAGMLTDAVIPDLIARFPKRPATVREIVRTAGMWESAVAEAMAPEVERTAGIPSISFLAAGGATEVVVTASAGDAATARELVAPTVAFARSVLGSVVYDAPTLEADVVRLLSAAGATVACAESLTAGLVTARIANVAGASAVLRGGVIPYATDLKSSLLEISRLKIFTWQAVSAETAEAMAKAVAERCDATYGVALTGVAGPAEQDGYPPGTVFIGISGPSGAATRQLTLPGDREQVRLLAVTNALVLLRLALRQDHARRRL